MYNESPLQTVILKIFRKAQEIFEDAPTSVFLFGSYARGDYDEESDINIMILVDIQIEKLPTYREVMSVFSTDLDLRYNVFTYIKLQDLSAFEEWKDTIPFYRKILDEGICINA